MVLSVTGTQDFLKHAYSLHFFQGDGTFLEGKDCEPCPSVAPSTNDRMSPLILEQTLPLFEIRGVCDVEKVQVNEDVF